MKPLKKALILLLIASSLWAGIQYAGGVNVNTTFTTTVGTRQEIVTGIETALTTAGWTVISGGGSGNVVMRSATTPAPASNTIDVRLNDPGAGNCAGVYLRNAAATQESHQHFLLPAALKVFRVIANRYQAFVFTPGASAAREVVAFGVPYIPTFLGGVIAGDFGWIMGNAASDGDATARATFRTLLGAQGATGAENSCYAALLNGNLLNPSCGIVATHAGAVRVQAHPYNSMVQANGNAYRWHDDSLIASEALVAWGLTAATDESKVRGQLWDAMVVSDPFAGDSTITLDAHSWWAFTNSNAGSTVVARGTLFVVVP